MRIDYIEGSKNFVAGALSRIPATVNAITRSRAQAQNNRNTSVPRPMTVKVDRKTSGGVVGERKTQDETDGESADTAADSVSASADTPADSGNERDGRMNVSGQKDVSKNEMSNWAPDERMTNENTKITEQRVWDRDELIKQQNEDKI